MEMHEEHPEWTARQIADELGCVPEQVHVAAHRIGIKLARHSDTLPVAVWFRMERPAFRELELAADEHGVSVNGLAKDLIEAIVTDDLFQAVLDKMPKGAAHD
jgi:hypothetical protein